MRDLPVRCLVNIWSTRRDRREQGRLEARHRIRPAVRLRNTSVSTKRPQDTDEVAAPRFDLPVIEPETQPSWDAARDGRYLVRRCRACGLAHHYPRPFCPECWSEDLVWEEVTGRGTLYTFSTVFVNDLPPFADRLPYVVAIVDLDEGPRVLTNIVDCEPDALYVDMPVEVVFEGLTPDITVARFRPR
jgi:uncharacterized OB-fold protein